VIRITFSYLRFQRTRKRTNRLTLDSSSLGESALDLPGESDSAILPVVQKEREKTGTLAKSAPGPLKKTALSVAGISLIILGIIGLVLPVLQGILMIMGGLGLLSIHNEGLRKWLMDLGKRYPRQTLLFKKIKMRILPERKFPS